MIQDEQNLGTLLDQSNCDWQLSCKHAYVEGKTIPGQEPNVIAKDASFAKIVSLCLQQAPDALQLRMTGNLVQVRGKICRLRACARNDADNRGFRCCQRKDVFRLGEHERLIDVSFDMDRSLDAGPVRGIQVILK